MGLAYTSPFEQTAKSFIPTSIPIDVSYLTAGFTGISFPSSTRIERKYLPVGVLLTVTEHTLPSNFLFGKNLTHPIFGSLTLLLSRSTDTEFIPVVYLRLELPFWGAVQDLIDDFEFLMSMIGEYNTRQAFQMLLIKTNGRINIQRNGLGGTSILRVGAEDDAQFMGKMDASNSLFTEIDNIYNGILDGSGVVPPMQSSSGDRPTGTTAMYYEPEMEWARSDAQMMNTAINDMANIFKYYVGVMEGDATGYNALRINATIEPYSYIDFSEWNNTIVQLVNARIISLQTAREECDFAANNEDDRMDEQDRRLNDMEARVVIEENNENNENNDNS